jgi:hypothetical protein
MNGNREFPLNLPVADRNLPSMIKGKPRGSRRTCFGITPLAVALLLTAGCATHIAPRELTNPPPSEPFSAFNRFELLPVRLATTQQVKAAAVRKIQENLDLRLKEKIGEWNSRPVTGPMAGSSAIVLRVSFVEKENHRLIADPEFFARAEAWVGAWSIGATDNVMLIRIANSVAVYVLNNYDRAVGGPVYPPNEQAPEMK